MNSKLYPLEFEPIYKEKVWGGEKLKSFLHKNITSSKTGESWEFSCIKEDISIVANGTFKGESFQTLLDRYKEKLIGRKAYKKYGHTFPLLFKFIDAAENLSLQLHPNNELAQLRHNSFGKTEMWYIVQADTDAGLYVGFKKGTTKEDYLHHIEKGSLQDIMNFEPVSPGDVFYIRPGLVHSIGEGVLLAEIQQSSDITYRLFDWNRKDLNGKPRELHTDLAMDAIDFEFDEFKLTYANTPNVFEKLVENQYFKTRKLFLTTSLEVDYTQQDSFVVWMCMSGRAEIEFSGNIYSLKMGETLMIPAALQKIRIASPSAQILEVSI